MHHETLTVLGSLPRVHPSPSACGSWTPFQVRPGPTSLSEPCWRCASLKFCLWSRLLDEPWTYVVVLLLAQSLEWTHWRDSGPSSLLWFLWDCQYSLLPAPCSAHVWILCYCVLAGEGTVWVGITHGVHLILPHGEVPLPDI